MLAAVLHVPLSFAVETFDSCGVLQLDVSEGGMAATGQRQRMGRGAAAAALRRTRGDARRLVEPKKPRGSVLRLHLQTLMSWCRGAILAAGVTQNRTQKVGFSALRCNCWGNCEARIFFLKKKVEHEGWKRLESDKPSVVYPVLYTWCTYESDLAHTQSSTSSWPHGLTKIRVHDKKMTTSSKHFNATYCLKGRRIIFD